MPIKPENRHRYPVNWQEIRARVKERSGDKCEWCGVKNGAIGYREYDGKFVMLSDGTDDLDFSVDNAVEDGFKVITIVLTVAHVHDHNPENCADDNLAHLCQRCHNKHDAPMRQAHARATKRAARAMADLFPCDCVSK